MRDALGGGLARAWRPAGGAGASALALALWALAALACAIVPLPQGLVDILLAASLAGSFVLLAASVTATRSSDLLWFPTLLLLMTLSRLALNVSTTRLILAEADAGRVVEAFASAVIRDDLAVGAAVFAIVTVVQLVVITRGTERIAEVAARFALDALPGQQAAIDADVKAGSLAPGEAAQRRARLIERANFCGAMDGAARYVRGDASAGLCVVAVNLVAGTAIGAARGLPLPEALALYGRLTIGDGLAAQVPALVASVAAAVMVARVEREESGAARGRLAPAALAAPAGLMAALALAPGTPGLVFAGAALGLLAGSLALAREGPRAPQVCVHLAGMGPAELAALRRPLAALRRRCAGALGIEVPTLAALPALRGDAPGVEVRHGGRVLGVQEDRPRGSDEVVLAVYRAVMAGAEALVDLEQVRAGIEAARRRRPAAVEEALKVIGPADLLELVRGLLRERVPVPPLDEVLAAAAAEPRFRRAEERPRWSSALRERLAGWFVREVVAAHERAGLRWARPRPDAEQALLERVVASEGALQLCLSGLARRAWLGRVLAGGAEGETPPLVVCSPRARPAFALLLARSCPHVTVLSTGELQAAGVPVPGEVGGPAASWFDAPGEAARGLTRAGVAAEITAS